MIAAKPVDNFKKFIAELRAHPEFKHHADTIEHALAHDDLTADTNSDMAAIMLGIEWILGHHERHIEEKLEMINRLFALEGKVHIASMHDWTGWTE